MIRNAVTGDLRRLWEIDRICFEPGIAYTRGQLRRFFELPGAECLVSEEGGVIDGFALGYSGGHDLAHVVTLDVLPTARRRGIGRGLLEALLKRLASAGARRPILEVDVRNAGAIAFYRRLGFRETGRIESYYGPGLDAYEMVREIPDPRTPGRASRRSPAATDAGAAASGIRRPPREG
ncbi:MAG TPA: GNAT family N-acetyltransferase [Thermoanaerobaculia bacterium]|nr:GNAT family N-acetyltransferase [Thermoanaerobaculia bacterium]